MRFTDGKKTIDIEVKIWDSRSLWYQPDLTADFFDVGQLPYDEESNTYKVEDVFYLVEQAEDWKNGVGDHSNDDALKYERDHGLERIVFTEEI